MYMSIAFSHKDPWVEGYLNFIIIIMERSGTSRFNTGIRHLNRALDRARAGR